ncbi:uncharacterized protein DUF2865 [Breoghania corrubedonensis]|uniref:Uncharacterized protein DUF2865 n=1 Tax=Breoghania corrubedonensis TaxID=665038 RepID=A0A2T5VB05_9HYPH|nr:DUF2865 domain-containing protein [Breoghania corrubedonensis]PTW60926.1 uncharacterized protein DUF2865 [Breoghania corrubedonensis]
MRFRCSPVLTAFGLAIMVTSGLCGSAEARDRRCYALEDELARVASLDDDRRGGAEVQQWDRALQDAAGQLDGLERRYRRAHCNGGGFLFSSPDPRICNGIERDIADTHARMARLSRNRSIAMRRSNGGKIAQRIATLRSQLASLRCNAPDYSASSRAPNSRYPQDPSVYGGQRGTARPNRNGVIDERGAAPREREGGLFGMLFGGGRRYQDERDPYTPYEDRSQGGGTYRTLCVRRCDGFFFPISFSTTEEQFAHDADQCQAMCPGTDAELYVYRNPGQDPSDMVSVYGTPYTDMENAFRYRTEYDADCTCKSKNMSVAGLGNAYDGDMTPLTGEGKGKVLNSSGDDAANDWDAGSGWTDTTTWDMNDPQYSGDPWDADDPWSGYRGAPNENLVTDVTPLPKLSADEDPDTIANQRGSYVPRLAKVTTPKTADVETASPGDGTAPGTREEPREPSRVRRVGPKYFVAQ